MRAMIEWRNIWMIVSMYLEIMIVDDTHLAPKCINEKQLRKK